MSTLDYYNHHSKDFYEKTIHLDRSYVQGQFLDLLTPHAYILDAGCGVGRDTKYFLSQGCRVKSFDASIEMVRYSTQETGQETAQMFFQDMDFYQEFDGVWASASLLHVPYEETKKIYTLIHNALKPNGIFCASYNYGSGYMFIEERDFYSMNEMTLPHYLKGLFEIIKIWTAPNMHNKKAGIDSKDWLNFTCRKI